MGLEQMTPIELHCPHCNHRERIEHTGPHLCMECGNASEVCCEVKSGGVEIITRHWWDGLSPRISTTIHHVLDYDPLPHVTIKPPPAPAPRLVKDGEPPRPFPQPSKYAQMHAERVGRARRLPEGDMTLPGYDLTARKKRDAALDRWWMGAALLTMMLLGRFVTAHDFDRFAETALALALGWVIGQLFRGPDKR